MSGWKLKGFWTNHGWDMIFSHTKLGCCLIGHLHICNFDFRTPIFILYEMYRKLKMLEYKYKHLLKSPIFPFDSRLWKGQFGNGKGMEKIHSQSSGTGREWKKSIPKIREREGNGKNPFPKFGNGKGMKKIHSRNSGTGREWKNPFPKFGKGNQRPPFLGMTGNGNSRSPLTSRNTYWHSQLSKCGSIVLKTIWES